MGDEPRSRVIHEFKMHVAQMKRVTLRSNQHSVDSMFEKGAPPALSHEAYKVSQQRVAAMKKWLQEQHVKVPC